MKRIRRIAKSERNIFEPVLCEEDIVGLIRSCLEAQGAFVFRVAERIPRAGVRWQRLSEPGIPDLMVWIRTGWETDKMIPGPKGLKPLYRLAYIEVKGPGGKLRPAQEAFLSRARECGFIAFKAECLEDVRLAFLEAGIKVVTR